LWRQKIEEVKARFWAVAPLDGWSLYPETDKSIPHPPTFFLKFHFNIIFPSKIGVLLFASVRIDTGNYGLCITAGKYYVING
jgi:hypothetical protein